MAEKVVPVQRLNFKMYPRDRTKTGTYQHSSGSPYIVFQFAQNATRVIDPKSVYLCGKFRIKHKQNDQCPANVYDIAGAASNNIENHEQVAYPNARIGVNSFIRQVVVGDLQGSAYEFSDSYNRNLASTVAVRNSYKSMCTFGNMSLTACANNDVMARESSSSMEFALPLQNGYYNSNPSLSLERGQEIKFQLESDANVLFGASSENMKYELTDVYLAGDFVVMDKPLTGISVDYVSFFQYNNGLNSGNEHLNQNLNLSRVNKIFHNFLVDKWQTNPEYDTFCTPPIMDADKDNVGDYVEAKIKQYQISRANISYPDVYMVNEEKANKADGFQTVRSRNFINSITNYNTNKSCLISPVTEGLDSMVMPRSDYFRTPQSPDNGFIPRWEKNEANGQWQRNGKKESGAMVYGLGCNLDQLNIRAWSSYNDAMYNFAIESELDSEPNKTFIFCSAETQLKSAGPTIVATN